MSTSALAVERRDADLGGARRLAVAWQHPLNRSIDAVGLLNRGSAGFSFSYLRSAIKVADFRPFLSLPDLNRRYESPILFPMFAQRVMRPSRPDFDRYLRSLGLADGASEWAILGRSQGQREGDGIQVFAEPDVDEIGNTNVTFFVSGLRHRLAAEPRVGAALDALAPGDRLVLVDDPDNPVDSRALLVAERTGLALAWIPAVLLPYVQTVRPLGEPEITVAGISGPDVPPGYRLLVTLRGSVPAGYQPFSGPAWEFASGH
jgi:hypothetical protein